MGISLRLFRKTALVPLLGMVFGGLAPAVQAAPAYYVWYTTDVLAQPAGGTTDHTISYSGCTYPGCTADVYLPQTSIAPPLFSAASTGVATSYGIDWTQQAGATWNGAAALGNVGGLSQANGSVDPVSAYYCNGSLCAGPYSNPYSAVGVGNTRVGWGDTVTITSDTLAAGTSVDLRFTLRMDSQIDLTGASVVCADNGNRAYAQSVFSLDLGTQLLGMKHDTCAYGFSSSATTLGVTGLGSSSNEISTLYGVTVGQTISIGGWLTTYAAANSYAAKPDMAALVNASGAFYLDVVTPDAGYFTASGVSYATPVPVPGTVWLLASGLACLAGFSRRNSRYSSRS